MGECPLGFLFSWALTTLLLTRVKLRQFFLNSILRSSILSLPLGHPFVSCILLNVGWFDLEWLNRDLVTLVVDVELVSAFYFRDVLAARRRLQIENICNTKVFWIVSNLLGIKRLVEHIDGKLPPIKWDFEGIHYFDNGPLTAQYMLVLDTLNFCFWPGMWSPLSSLDCPLCWILYPELWMKIVPDRIER